MNEAFVIMRIGDKKLDEIWRDVYFPVLKECGLEPRRVDKHNEGKLLSSEIAEFIRRSKIIIADLTHERPNCYLEVGLAMGYGKLTNTILCIKKGDIVHFDLSGYEILFWDEQNIDLFKKELAKKIKYRLQILESNETIKIKEDKKFQKEFEKSENWIKKEQELAFKEYQNSKINNGYYEVIFRPRNLKIKRKKSELKSIAYKAECHNTGWPMGVVLSKKELAPKVTEEGIRAIISTTTLHKSFDYWALKNNGYFYFLRNYDAESRGSQKVLYFDVRIWRIAEVILYCSRLFKEFGFSEDDKIGIYIKHYDLGGRVLTASKFTRSLFEDYTSMIDSCPPFEIEESIKNLSQNENIKKYTYEIANDLFVNFDFANISKQVIFSIVHEFLNSRI